MSDIKIFVSHRIDMDAETINNPLFYPVRCGAVYDKRDDKPDIQGDDTGANISDKRNSYCELTVLYWAWKNMTTDYYGFCHYRRYFVFNHPADQVPDKYSNISFDCFNEEVLSQVISKPDNIIAKMAGQPIALTSPFDVRNINTSNNYEHYTVSPNLHGKDIDVLLSVIHDLFPEYDKAAKDYIEGHLFYPCNMFIMEKDLFSRYCTWLFSILRECEKRIDLANYNVDEMRVMGHLGERCLGIFYTYLHKNENIDAVFFQRALILNTDVGKKIIPRFREQVTIVTASSNYYIPYLAIMIQSLFENSSPENKYGLYILHTTVSAENQKKIKTLEEKYSNVYIDFYDMSFEISSFQFKPLEWATHIANETFYRTLIHKVFVNFDKVLYLDSDIIVQSDVAILFRTEIGCNLIGACIDGDFIGSFSSNDDARQYVDKILKLQRPLEYFQGGVLLMNINQFRREFDDYQIVNLAINANYRWGDQDIFNVCCQGKVYFLDSKWNVMVQHRWDRIALIKKCPLAIYNQYLESRNDPKIIHYAGAQKPWDDPDMDFATEFWKVAKRTPFYEILLSRLAVYATREINHAVQTQPMTPDQVMDMVSLKKLIKRALKKIIRKPVIFLLPKGTLRRKIIEAVYNKIFNRY